jgi:predicted aconitase with swiveling domain
MARVIDGRPVVPGSARATALVTDTPLSFWGGYSAIDGTIIDHRHPLHGANARGKILVLPGSRGSSTTSAVLLEAVHNETAPAGFITAGVDRFIALTAVVAEALYGKGVPVVAVSADDLASIPTGADVRIARDGTITIDADS